MRSSQAAKSPSTEVFLRKVPLFQRLPEDNYSDLVACVDPVTFQKGQVIIKEGELGEDFYVLKNGSAQVSVGGENVAVLAAEDYFGENALLQNTPRSATITASGPTEALKITRSRFQQFRLHEKLEVPKKEKGLTKRHKMMARQANAFGEKKPEGFASKNQRQSLLGSVPNKGWRQSMDMTALGSMTPTYSQGPPKPFLKSQMIALKDIFTDKLNITSFFLVPVGQYVKYAEYSAGAIFAMNFLAIVPLASILGQSTEALASHTGQLIGGLLNATFGNAVEMIMCIQAVKAGLISVVQGNLLGSILSNLLLVLGMSIIASGFARHEQKFNTKGAAANMSCQLVASISVCLPTVFASIKGSTEDDVLTISRICSGFLVLVYAMFLYFMLKSHAEMFQEEEEEEHEEGDDELSPSFSVILLLLCTLVVFFCSECLVDSIDEVSARYGLSKDFIGVILLPIVGNAAEHATAVTCAYKGMMDLALGVAVGSSTQIALFVVPCAVVAGYFYDSPMNLNFTVFDSTCQMLTVFLVSQVLSHGVTNWLHGVMLIAVYIFIAVIALFSRD